MKKNYITLIAILWVFSMLKAQSSFLQPCPGYKANDLFPAVNYSVFDVSPYFLIAGDDDTICRFNIETNALIQKYGKPAGYNAFAAFVTLSPDGAVIWAGYSTTGNIDDRIYAIDVQTGVWTMKAVLAANFDLAFYNNFMLVSALNSANWGDPNCIFVLDQNGSNNHHKIIETGGSPAGLAVSNTGDLLYATSFFSQPNALYRWSSSDMTNVINNINAGFLTLDDAVKLSDLPQASYDCASDDAANIIFNFNSFSSDKVLAKWNGTTGDGLNFDTIALASDGADWLKTVKTRGDITSHEFGNQIFANSFGRPIAEIHLDYLPQVVSKIPNFSAYETDANFIYNLTAHFADPDDAGDFIYAINGNSSPSIAQVSIDNSDLVIDFLLPGQTNITLEAVSAGQSVSTSFVIGVYPKIEGDYEVAGFGDLSLQPNSFWNGSDLSGGFQSGPLNFPNNYTQSLATWNGWAYSNMADDTTTGYINQYSAITTTGFDVSVSQNPNYGIGFVPIDFVDAENIPIPLYFNDGESHEVKGLFVTNSTYAALTMEWGDDGIEKFGGASGNDPDYFLLSVFGYFNGNISEVLDFYLADYRFDDNAQDYIIKTWQWLELSSLGEVDSLKFTLSSSDVGAYGMNTPPYFCVDQFYIVPQSTAVIENAFSAKLQVNIFPNPATDFIKISFNSDRLAALSFFDMTGNKVFESENFVSGGIIDLKQLVKGSYLLRIQIGNSLTTKRLIKFEL